MSSQQLDSFTHNQIRLTFAEIFRNDQFGEWSFKEIGFRNQTNNDFEIIYIPRQMNSQQSWEICKRLLVKKKTANEIQSILEYINNKR